MPVGSPPAPRSRRPPAGSEVSAPRPARRRAPGDAHAEWPSWLVRKASRSPAAASSAPASRPASCRSLHPRPVSHASPIACPCRRGDPGGDLGAVGSVVERDRTPGPRQSDEMDVEVVKSRNDRGFAGVDDPRSAGGGIRDLRSRAGAHDAARRDPDRLRGLQPIGFGGQHDSSGDDELGALRRSSVQGAGEAWRLVESMSLRAEGDPHEHDRHDQEPVREEERAPRRAADDPRAALTGGP